MMKSDEQYQVPVWMRPLLPLLCNTGGNDPEELLNDTETTASANIVRYVLIVAVRSQIDLLQLLYRKGLLRTEIPGGFSPEEAQELLDNLVRSHISKALSGERMPAQDDWILIYSKHGEYMAGQVQGEYVELSDGTLSWLGNALFWMPLPEPPQEAK